MLHGKALPSVATGFSPRDPVGALLPTMTDRRRLTMTFRSLTPFRRAGTLARGDEGDPFAALRREMDRMFDDFGRGWLTPETFASEGRGVLSPRVDIAETDKGLELTAELPGADEKNIDLELADGVLTLKAERQTRREEKDEKTRYHVVERSEGSYMRRFALPFEADEDKVEASFDKGILHVFVPRSSASEKASRKIAIGGRVTGDNNRREAA
jgi:HSP20 family protein